MLLTVAIQLLLWLGVSFYVIAVFGIELVPPAPEQEVPASKGCSFTNSQSHTKHFPACTSLSNVLKAYWMVRGSASENITIDFAMESALPLQNWAALGFPATPGQMIGSTALVLAHCICSASAPSSMTLTDFFLRGKATDAVTPPGHLKVENIQAGAINSTAVGEFTVHLPVNTLLQNGLLLPVVYATGQLDPSSFSSPSTQQLRFQHHSVSGAASLDLSGSSHTSSSSSTFQDSSIKGKKNAHAWLMVFGWSFLLCGAVVARSFKTTLGPIWFQIHRATQIFGLECVLSAFIVIFSALGGKKTTYTLHFNLGVAAFVLGLTQLTALVFRPHLSSPFRRAWALSHHWVGRSALLLAVANIYYGLISVKKVGTWAVISFSVVFGLIIGVGAVKEGIDYLHLPPPALMKRQFANLDEEREVAAVLADS